MRVCPPAICAAPGNTIASANELPRRRSARNDGDPLVFIDIGSVTRGPAGIADGTRGSMDCREASIAVCTDVLATTRGVTAAGPFAHLAVESSNVLNTSPPPATDAYTYRTNPCPSVADTSR